MDSSASIETHHDPHSHAAEHEHHELGWWRKYIFSTDHKVIGIQYGLCGLAFLFLGFCLMMLMRWQLAYPGQALPVIGKFLPHIFGAGSMPDGKMTPDFYNSLGAMHGTIMIFLGVVPLAFAAFGNFVVPLQIGAPDMTFPKVNAASFWAFAVGGVIMLISFFVPGGAAKSGWTSYTPLAAFADSGPGHDPLFNGQTLWLIGFIFLITSSLLGAVNFITTIIQLRAKGLTWMRLPLFVWAHHMWLTGMGSAVSAFFQTTTLLISIPSVIILSAFFISLWGGSIRFNVPMLFTIAFLPMFGIGGLTGIPLAFNSADLYLHDTYYVIAHFHYIVAPGTIFAVFAGIYFWFPKATGRRMSEFWGKVHFWPSLICMNVIFLPMFLQGMLGMHRRWYDGGQGWNLAGEKVWGLSGFEWNTPISIAAWTMGLAQIPFIINFFWSMKRGEKVDINPWHATTLEWNAPSPPPHGNFTTAPTVYRGPYEYSLPGRESDYTRQTEPLTNGDRKAYEAAAAAGVH